MHTLKKIGRISFAVTVAIFTLYGLFRIYNAYEAKRFDEQNKKDLKRTIILSDGDVNRLPGWKEVGEYPPLGVVRSYGLYPNGSRAFDVTYKLDQYGLRLEEKLPGDHRSHLLLGGCSFIFGVALNADETLSSHLRRKLPEVNVVNLGHGGGGLHSQLRAFDLLPMKEIAQEEEGTYIYFFYYDHLARWKGSPSYLSWAPPEAIHFEWKNTHYEAMPLKEFEGWKEFQKARSAGLEMVYQKSRAIARDEWPLEDLKDFVRGVGELKRKYLSVYPKGNFRLVFYPYFFETKTAERVRALLKDARIDHDYLSDEFNQFVARSQRPDSFYTVPVDGHPNAHFNQFLSDLLIQKIPLDVRSFRSHE